MLKKKNILVVCSHPDDEVLGCGASLNKLKKKNNIFCLYLTNGGTNRPKLAIKKNINAINKVKKIIGIQKTYMGEFPDNEIDKVSLCFKIIFANSSDLIFNISRLSKKYDFNFDFPKKNSARSNS